MNVEVVKDLEFRRVGEKRLLLDLYLPQGRPAPLPVIVWVCGGGWQSASKNGCPKTSAWAAERGFAVAPIDYRVSSEAVFPAQIQDCKAAVRWLRAHADEYRLDPDRIGAWGDSAGGHLVELLGLTESVKELEGEDAPRGQSSRVQAVCAFFAPSDLEDLGSADEAVTALLGGPPAEKRERARQASPITYASPDAPPFLLVHGDRDDVVPLAQSERFRDALLCAGVEVTLHVAEGIGHDGDALYGNPEIREMVADFFEGHLRPARG